MPKISCIMPVYNTVKYLDECIKSILNQSFTDFEFIISDDGSTDGSKKIIEKYKNKDSRIIFLDNKNNRGICANLNDCIKLAKGEYIAIMESDDISYEKRFEIQIKEFNKDKNFDLIGSSAQYIDNKGKTLIKKVTGALDENEIKKTFFKKIGIITPSFMIKKNSILKVGILKYSEVWDYELYVKLILKGKRIKNLDNILIKKRIHNNSTYNKKGVKINKILMDFKKDIIKSFKINKLYYLSIYKEFIKNYFIHIIKKSLINSKFYNFLYKNLR